MLSAPASASRHGGEVFLAEMSRVVPYVALMTEIGPHYQKTSRRRHFYVI